MTRRPLARAGAEWHIRAAVGGAGDIAAELRVFIAKYIDSVAQVEVLILLRTRGAPTTADAVAEALRIDPTWTAAELDRLAARGLVSVAEADTAPAYAPVARSPDLEEALSRLIELYVDRRPSVINMIYNPPPDAMRAFAEAFRFRKDRE